MSEQTPPRDVKNGIETSSADLDAEELRHLAELAIQREDPEAALTTLKRLLQLEPEDGQALYLLGAVHAGLGMHARAIDEISRAIELLPDIPIARFQLGLLYVLENQAAEATEVWKSLDVLGDGDPLFLFKRGIEHYLEDRVDECIADLERGLELNVDNEGLSNDIQNILTEAIRERAESEGEVVTPEVVEDDEVRPVELSAYRDGNGTAETSA
ncbi:tetratricopeptide repeat protein [Myxococcota bacterium]|nr:tetratricopeptide repeat protein [Myxococcota bacterium]